MGTLYTEITAKVVKSWYMHQQKLMQPGSQVLSPKLPEGTGRTEPWERGCKVCRLPQNIHGSTVKAPVQI